MSTQEYFKDLELLTKKQVAHLFKCSPRLLRELNNKDSELAKKLPQIKIGCRTRYRLQDVQKFLEPNCNNNTTRPVEAPKESTSSNNNTIHYEDF